jgi:hypothetical protein
MPRHCLNRPKPPGVELRRPATARSLVLAALDLVRALGNGMADTAPAQLAAGRGVRVRLVSQQVTGPVPGLAEGIQQRHQVRIVAGLPG